MSDYKERRKIFTYFKSKKTDILCLQETYSQYHDEKFWRSEWGNNDVLFSHGSHNSRGVAIFFNKSFEYKIIDTTTDEEGRFIVCTIKCHSRYLVLSAVYGPNQDSPDFYVSLFRHLRQAPFPEWIILGDFNLTLDPKMDRKSHVSNCQIKKAALVLKEFMEDHELHDVWRCLHPTVKRYTWHGRISLASRLDFVLASNSLMSRIKKCEVISSTISDHSALLLEMELQTDIRGPGFWKFNDTLLRDDKYKSMIIEKLDQVMLKNSKEKLDPLLSWEMIKNEVIGRTLAYASLKAKERRQNVEKLELKIDQLETQLDQSNELHEMTMLYNQLVSAKHDLETILIQKTAKVIANTKAKWYNEGEASTKYFFNLEKQKSHAKCMNEVYLEDGTKLTERNKILKEQKRFYQELYQSDQTVKFSLENSNEDRKLSIEERDALETPLTDHEILTSLKSMASGKTPGSDGLTPAFYTCFWDSLSTPLLCAFNYAKQQGQLHISARRGILSLIPKKDRDNCYIKNWRPITLLNTDYKILSKAIANRVQKYLSKLISLDQTGFMKDRNISTNIRKIIDIDEYCRNESIEAILLSVDAEKCFDKVETRYIDRIMDYFNFGPNLIEWVKILFKNIMVCTLNYGFISEHFNVSQGLLQGNPIASYIYLLVAQTLNDKIAQNPLIKGINLRGNEIKTIQFADDLNLPLLFDQETLTQVLKELRDFKSQTGMTINVDKSCIYRIGAIADSTIILNSQGIPWVNSLVNVLGVTVTKKENLEQVNVEPLINKMQARLNMWKARDLSIVGKVMVLNSLIMSIFVYRFSVIPLVSKNIIHRINKIWSEFLWNGKKPKIAWKILCAPKRNGGLGLSELSKRDISLKCQWVSIYVKDKIIAILGDYFLQNKIGALLWECNIQTKDCPQVTGHRGFWYDVLKSWAATNFFNPTGTQQICEQILWMNSHIRINNKISINMEMFNAGIVRVKDVLNANLQLMSIEDFRTRYPAVNYLGYISVLNSLPEEWRKCLRNQEQAVVNNSSKFTYVERGEPIVRIVYDSLHTNVYLLENKWNRWGRILCEEFFPNDFIMIVRKVWSVTQFSKLRSFQFKLLNHAIITNVQLKIWNLRDTDLCSFCQIATEDYLHLFCNCAHVARIFMYVQDWCDRLTPDNDFSDRNILFNTVNKNPHSVVNTIVLITKYYVYQNRCLQQDLNINQLREVILYHNKMEYLGAISNNHLEKHNKKWEHMLAIIKY